MRIGFDLDGTLITCEPKHSVLMSILANAHHVRFDRNKYWQDKRMGLNNKLALINQGVSKSTAAQMNTIWINSIERIEWACFDKLFSDTKVLLQELRAKGHTLHLVSARNHIPNANLQLRLLGIDQLFDSVDFVSVQSKKTKSFYFEKRFIDCYFGDTEADFEATQIVNIDFYSVLTGMRNREFFASLIPNKSINRNLKQALISMKNNL